MLYQNNAVRLSQSRLARGSRTIRNFTKVIWNLLFKVRLQADFPLTFHKLVSIFIAGCLLNVLATHAYAQVFGLLAVQFAKLNISVIDQLASRPSDLVSTLGYKLVCFEQYLFSTYGQEKVQGSILAIAMAGCFVFAFGLQIFFMRWCFKKAGVTSFTKAIALNLDSVNGSWKKVLLYVLLFAFFVFAPAQLALELVPRGPVIDPAAQYMKTLSGVFWWLNTVLIVLIGPILEEIIFRGVLMNGLRTSLTQLRLPNWVPQFVRKFFSLRLFHMVSKPTLANIMALVLSSVLFAACHLTPSGFPDLMITAMVCGWLYLRSGTLWCPIWLHVLNNLVTLIVTNLPR